MIRIKNYIFNENEISYIWESDEEELYVQLKTDIEENVSNCKKIRNTTFEDIEWNYENNNEYCNVFYEDRIKELEYENKKLKETIKELSLQKEITIKGYDYLKPPYEVTCKGSEE